MSRWRVLMLVAMLGCLVWSGLAPFDRTTWVLEIFPIVLAVPLLWWTRHSFPLSSLLFVLVMLHCLVLMLGGAYSYARVPFGFFLQDLFELSRNPYDKIGHFFQGLVPALVCREILLRGAYVSARNMLNFLTVCVVLAISATYELIEWAAAVALGQGADEFLGTQGDPWDTQSDMALALIGALSCLLLLSRWHDRQLAAMQQRADVQQSMSVTSPLL
ncbi:MAG TPA: hypothetical protein DCS87_07435 [Rheinheimera sp.]|nr:hypothetical protein [Rheinheimera sp.]